MYDYGYDYGYAAEATTSMLGVMGGLFFGIMIFSSIIGLISIISYAKIFTKAGKPWWASIIPLYNIVVMIEIAKLPMWYIILFFVPVANIYALFKINIEMAKKFGKEVGFGIGMTLLSIIFIPLLAFSDNKYEDDSFVSENTNTQFDANNVDNNVSVNNDNVVVAPVVEVTSTPVEPVTIENNPFAPVGETVPAEPVMENVPVVEPSIEPVPVSVTPVESVPVEPTVANIPTEPVVEVAPIENISEEQVNVEPAVAAPVENVLVTPIENVPTEPVIETAPIENVAVEPVVETNSIETVNVEPTVNAFNMAPEITTEPINEVETMNFNETAIPEMNFDNTIQLAANVAEDKKVCKNCGNELPDIVSICPNCGTDNE